MKNEIHGTCMTHHSSMAKFFHITLNLLVAKSSYLYFYVTYTVIQFSETNIQTTTCHIAIYVCMALPRHTILLQGDIAYAWL